LKAQFLSTDIMKEQAEMGYDSDNGGHDYNGDHAIHDL
jgi:hypothetical protein